MDKDLIKAQEAAYFLGVSKTTIRAWHANGKLVPFKINPLTKIRYYRKIDLKEFLEAAKAKNLAKNKKV